MLKINHFITTYPIITNSVLSILCLVLLFIVCYLLEYYFPSFFTFTTSIDGENTYFVLNFSYLFYVFLIIIYGFLCIYLLISSKTDVLYYLPLALINLLLVFLTTYYIYELASLPIAKPQGGWTVYPPLDIEETMNDTHYTANYTYATFLKIISCLFGWQFVLLISLVMTSFKLGKIIS